MASRRNFLTYPEYKAYCYSNGVKPRPEADTGPFVTDLAGAAYAPRDLSAIFSFVANPDGFMTRTSLKKARERVRFEGELLEAIFEITGREEISQDLFTRLLG